MGQAIERAAEIEALHLGPSKYEARMEVTERQSFELRYPVPAA